MKSWLNIICVWLALDSFNFLHRSEACKGPVNHTWWRHQMETFSALPAIFMGNSPVPMNSPHKGQWRGALMFTLICARINGWVNNREAGEWRRHRCHYYVIVICLIYSCFKLRRQFHLLLVNFTYMGIVPVWPRYGIQLFASDTLAARYISYLLIGERRECLNSEYTSLPVPGKHIHHTMIIQIIGIFVLRKTYTQTRLLKSIHPNSFSARTSYFDPKMSNVGFNDVSVMGVKHSNIYL